MPQNFDYTLSFRLVNVAITEPIQLSETVTLNPLTPTEMSEKYGNLEHVPTALVPNLEFHNVEVVYQRVGRDSEYERNFSIEGCYTLGRAVVDAIMLAIPSNSIIPYAVQMLLVSKERNSIAQFCDIGSYVLHPEPLRQDTIQRVQKIFNVLENARKDSVLTAAVDRLILARRRDLHHDNRINQPNWDKAVDYVIGLESIFLTVNGNALAQELSYRFRLNGVSLLSSVTAFENRQLFNALKYLYELRSSVVHGQNNALNKAEKFIDCLDIDEPENKHPLGRLDIVCRQLECFYIVLLTHLIKLAPTERPYRVDGGWENLLWQ